MTEKPTALSPYRILFPTTDDRDKFLRDPISRGLWLDSSPVTAQWAEVGALTNEHLAEVEAWLIKNCPGALMAWPADSEAPTILGMDEEQIDQAVGLIKALAKWLDGEKVDRFCRNTIVGKVIDAAFDGRDPTVDEMRAAGERASELAKAFLAGAYPRCECNEEHAKE